MKVALRDLIGALDDPMEKLMFLAQIAKTVEQNKFATFEDCCGWALKWIQMHGHPSDLIISRWLDEHKQLAEMEIPENMEAALDIAIKENC